MPPSTLSLRAIDPDDTTTLDAYLEQMSIVFTMSAAHTAERREWFVPWLREHRLSGVFDGDRIVGTYRSWDWEVTVPGGGTITADAVSAVTVRPTHRRRGVLTTMITADLADAHARSLPAAVLLASEAPIYGRYGFGIATETATWEVDLAAARVAPQVPRVGSVELVTPQELRDLAPAVFEATRRPAATDRSRHWWDLQCGLAPVPGEPVEPRAGVLYRADDGTPQGYAFYSWKEDWQDWAIHTVATVHDLQAVTAEAYAGLWRFFTELDLVATVRAHGRPVDEALPWLLTNSRAARRTGIADMLWVRLFDPAAALTARRYESPGRAVLQVTDPFGYAAGRFALDVDDAGVGKCVATEADADVTLPVDVLSALYLGGGDLHGASVAGRVTEHVAGTVDRVARLLRTTRAPWTGTWF